LQNKKEKQNSVAGLTTDARYVETPEGITEDLKCAGSVLGNSLTQACYPE